MKEEVTFLIDLIKEVKQYPCLFDWTSQEYLNRQLKDNIWTVIGSKLGETGATCKNKWKVIRASYIRSIHLKAKSSTERRGYYLEPYLGFLIPYLKPRHYYTRPSLPSPPYPDDLIMEDNQNIQEVKPVVRPVETQPELENEISYALEQPMEHFIVKRAADEPERTEARNPCELYLLSLMPHVSTMTPRQQLMFQKGVVELIDAIKYGDLT